MAFIALTTFRAVLEQRQARNPECKNSWRVSWSIHLTTNGAFPRELKSPCPVKICVMIGSLRCSMVESEYLHCLLDLSHHQVRRQLVA